MNFVLNPSSSLTSGVPPDSPASPRPPVCIGYSAFSHFLDWASSLHSVFNLLFSPLSLPSSVQKLFPLAGFFQSPGSNEEVSSEAWLCFLPTGNSDLLPLLTSLLLLFACLHSVSCRKLKPVIDRAPLVLCKATAMAQILITLIALLIVYLTLMDFFLQRNS